MKVEVVVLGSLPLSVCLSLAGCLSFCLSPPPPSVLPPPPRPLCRGNTQSAPYIKAKPSFTMCLVGHCCTRTIVLGARVKELVKELVRRSFLCHRSPVSSAAPPARRSFELHKAEWYVDLTLPPLAPFPLLRAGGGVGWGGGRGGGGVVSAVRS